MSAPELPETPDTAVLARVLDGLRSLPEQTRRVPDGGSEPVPGATDAEVPLPRRR
ncbi:hypothetical protein [Actinomycetospora termitidis]|uniref:Uncharacterized protein n=1 Tax=Actinomycetospora termitidis TaxID=3053470 RepID=A0ABT7M654_9PSEU|nr:hypothetical protein [Actinomycetospora sp. Odt1-22]MDL5155729.1 hypothetical protein [Actinomycetospora sp. Odt1-22]